MSSVAGDIPDTKNELDIFAVLDVLLIHRWFIAAIAVVFALLGTAYAFLVHPKYQVDMMVQIESSLDTSGINSLPSTMSSLFNAKSSAAAEAQILASRLVVTRAVDQMKYYIDVRPKRFPLIGDFISRFNRNLTVPGLLGIGGYAWGQESALVDRFDVPKDIQGDKFTLTMEEGGGWRLSGSDLDVPVRGHIGVESTFPTSYGPVVLRVAGFHALPGTRFTLIRNPRLRTILDVQDKLDVQEKIKQSDVVIATLLGDDAQRVGGLLREIGNQYVRQNIERKSADAAHSLAFVDSQLPSIKQRLEQAQERYTAMRNTNGTVDLPEEARLALQQTAELKTQMLLLQQKRQELATRFNAAHPSLIAIDRQIADLRQQQAGFDVRIQHLPGLQQDAARLMLDVRVDTDLYTALLNNSQQLQLTKAGNVGSVRVVDLPVVPEDPVRPNRPVVIAGAALVGLVVAIGLAFSRDLLFGGIAMPDEIEGGLGLSVYASVPTAASQRTLDERIEAKASGSHVLALEAPDDPAVESLRSLRTALRFSSLDSDNNVLLVTGAEPGTGKSFVLANLAAVLGAGGKRVVVIDADMRRGYLNQYFGVAREPGLSEVLSGDASESEVIHQGAIRNVDFIATGALPANVGDLLLGERTSQIIAELRKRYDYVMIDAPPLLVAADATILGRHVSFLLLVARAGQTRIGDLRESVKRLAHGGVKATGVILNGLSTHLGRYGGKFGAYRYFPYSYRQEKERSFICRVAQAVGAWRHR